MSKIEWTEKTWNPVTGCTKISEGCQNCYAEKMHKRLQAMGQAKYQHDFNEIELHPEELNRDFGKKPKRIFVNSMSDIFHPDIPVNFVKEIFWTAVRQPQHTFQFLTKRVNNPSVFLTLPHFSPNIWVGVTVENVKYKNRIDMFKEFGNFQVKFLSCEPLLGDLGELDLTGINWVIVGGESGPNARPMHPDWVRNIQRQCHEQKVPFFFKQWGEWSPMIHDKSRTILLNNGEIFPIVTQESLAFYCHHNKLSSKDWRDLNPVYITKVGKKKAGCLLDDKEYKGYPA